MADDRELAPEPLRVVQDFVNTLDIETGEDEIGTPAGLQVWLGDHGFGGPTTDDDVARAREVREGLRALLDVNAGRPADQESVDRLNRALGPVSAHLHIDAGGASLSAASGGLDAGLAAIAQTVMEASADGTWARLKACRAETCRWAFYDRSKNRSGAWCTMAVCGSRMKVRAYRERHSTQS